MFDPEFCERRCPICTGARRGNRLAKALQSVELLLTGGGCPWGRARARRYGVQPDQPVPDSAAQNEAKERKDHDV